MFKFALYKSDVYNSFDTGLNQADIFLAGLKQLIKKQNSVNALLNNKVKSLQLQNKVLAMKNTKLMTRVESLEKERSLKRVKSACSLLFLNNY